MRTEERVPAPATSASTLAEEVGVVLALSLVGSAVYAVIDLFEAPVAGVYTFSFPQVNLARQLAGTILDLAPVWLVPPPARRGGAGGRGGGGGTGDRAGPRRARTGIRPRIGDLRSNRPRRPRSLPRFRRGRSR